MTKIIKFSIILLLLFNIFSHAVLADDVQPLINGDSGNLSKDSDCMKTGNCQLNDFMKVALNVSNIILGLVGSLALLAFIFGGLMWMFSAGNQERVTRGRQAILGAVIGLAIVFTSFMIIQLVYSALGIDKASGGKWAITGWFK